MSVRPDTDLLILGGGCAGLSLSNRLAHQPDRGLRVEVLEARRSYTNDRTWCFWGPDRHRYRDLVKMRWRAWQFSTPYSRLRQQIGTDVSYQCIPAESFYANALQKISTDEHLHLRLGVRVNSVEQDDRLMRVETTAGTRTARWVIDTRPGEVWSNAEHGLTQYFSGVEVEASRPIFDPATAGLMLDMESDEHGFRFTYLLPFTVHHALIEETRFAREATPELLDSGLQLTLQRMSRRSDLRELRREQGRIPMASSHRIAATRGRYVKAGLLGGAARPSTGYAFERIQRWADLCMIQLQRGRAPVAHPPDPLWRNAVDGLFLRVLRRSPERAPQMFMALAHGVAPTTLVRFLSDHATLRDFYSVARALPKRPFLEEIGTVAVT